MNNQVQSIELSIIIANWNQSQLLKNCLDSLEETHPSLAYEIIVVDNYSRDDSVEMLNEKYPAVRLIENKENLGFARANNQAIKIARGSYFLLLNNDTLFREKEVLSTMLDFMKNNANVGVVGCRLIYPDGSLQSEGERFPSVWRIFKSQILFEKSWRRVKIRHRKVPLVKTVDYVCGACLMTKREVFDKVGLLQEDYFIYGEDVEFCYRVQGAGYMIKVLTEKTVIHLHSKSTEKDLSHVLYHSIQNDLKNIKLLYRNNLKVTVGKSIYLMGILLRMGLACFRKNKKSGDYLKLFFSVIKGK